MTASGVPDYDELPLRGGIPCSWGVWGDHDVFGCLNLLTSERTLAATEQVKRGSVFSLNWAMTLPDPPLFGRVAPRHEIRSQEGSRSQDDQLQNWNTQASSQWDGFRHVRREGTATTVASQTLSTASSTGRVVVSQAVRCWSTWRGGARPWGDRSSRGRRIR